MQSGDHRRSRLLMLALVAALLLTACGEGSGGGYGNRAGTATDDATTAPAPPPNAEEGTTFVSLASVPGLGLVLADSGGRTLYALDADRGGTSSCYGRCAEAWPPLLTEGDPHPSNGASAAEVGTGERRDGTAQVTYAGQPLYTYAGDEGPGEASGDGVVSFGGTWFALKANGQPAG